MKKILLLGGSHRDIPLINAAKELGYFVITLGDRDYYIGHNYSNKAYKISFNDFKKIKEIIKYEKIDFLLPGCGEESYLNTVKLSKELNIGNFDELNVAKLIHNKWEFKQFCLKNNISTPNGFFYEKENDLKEISFPVVVKPTNLSGGRGVDIVSNMKSLLNSIEKAKRVSPEIFLEEYIAGELIAYSIFIKNKKIIFEFFAKDDVFLNKYLITTAYPIEISSEIKEKLKYDIEKIASKLCLTDGMFHLQIIISDNKPYIIDVSRRIPGDLFPFLIENSTDIKYSKAVVNSYLGKRINPFPLSKKKFIIRHCIMPNKNGIYKDLYIDNTIKDKIIYNLKLLPPNTVIKDFLNTQLEIVLIELAEFDRVIINEINKLIFPIIE